MRNLARAVSVAKGHVSAMLDSGYSHTGHGFVTGSYDNSIRVFGRDDKSRDVYYTSRMQRSFCVKYFMDTKKSALRVG